MLLGAIKDSLMEKTQHIAILKIELKVRLF